jgi:hypothetical protein
MTKPDMSTNICQHADIRTNHVIQKFVPELKMCHHANFYIPYLRTIIQEFYLMQNQKLQGRQQQQNMNTYDYQS